MTTTLNSTGLGDVQREEMSNNTQFDIMPIPEESSEETIVFGFNGLFRQIKVTGIYTDTGGTSAGAWVALIDSFVDDVQEGGYVYHSDFYDDGHDFTVKIQKFQYVVEFGEPFNRVSYELILVEGKDG